MAKQTLETLESEVGQVMENAHGNALVQNLGMILATMSILLTLWKIASFLQELNHQIRDLHKDFGRQTKTILDLHGKYENVYFFLIRQHGIEIVQKHFRHDKSLEELNKDE